MAVHLSEKKSLFTVLEPLTKKSTWEAVGQGVSNIARLLLPIPCCGSSTSRSEGPRLMPTCSDITVALGRGTAATLAIIGVTELVIGDFVLGPLLLTSAGIVLLVTEVCRFQSHRVEEFYGVGDNIMAHAQELNEALGLRLTDQHEAIHTDIRETRTRVEQLPALIERQNAALRELFQDPATVIGQRHQELLDVTQRLGQVQGRITEATRNLDRLTALCERFEAHLASLATTDDNLAQNVAALRVLIAEARATQPNPRLRPPTAADRAHLPSPAAAAQSDSDDDDIQSPRASPTYDSFAAAAALPHSGTPPPPFLGDPDDDRA